jgi:hypothetical protein
MVTHGNNLAGRVWLFSKVGFCRVALFPHGTARMFSDVDVSLEKFSETSDSLGCFRVELGVHRELGTCDDFRSQKVAHTTAQLISIASV